MPELIIDVEVCKSCEFCIVQCPKKVLRIGSAANKKGYRYAEAALPESCIGCRVCATICPEGAIEIQK